jgi:Tol biopolymer transport system component
MTCHVLLRLALALVATIVQGAPPVPFDAVPGDATGRISHDGASLIYAANRDGTFRLFARPTRAGHDQELFASPPGTVAFSPAVAPDGQRLYFESNLRMPSIEGRRDTGVWVMDRTPSGWTSPRAVGGHFDSDYNEHSPTVDAFGTLCFNSGRPGSQENDIYCGTVAGTLPPERLAEVNSAAEDASPWLNATGNLLVFTSNRDGGVGGWDVYVSRRVNGQWTAPRNIGPPINTSSDELSVSLSPTGDRLYFFRVSPGSRQAYSVPFDVSRADR